MSTTTDDNTQNVKVYIRDQAYAWLPGSIEFIKDGKAFVRIDLPKNWHSSTILCRDSGLEEAEKALLIAAKAEAAAAAGSSSSTGNNDDNHTSGSTIVRAVPLSSYPNGQLPLQNYKCTHKDDMTTLPHLHEAAMLYNLKERNTIGKPYTRVRDVIVAMNPFTRIEKLYSYETQRFYAQKLVWEAQKGMMTSMLEEEKKEDMLPATTTETTNRDLVEPHIYEVACLAYQGLTIDNQDQTILVTGESGSGKTETVKILLEHLATLESLRPTTSTTVDNNNNMQQNPNNINIVNKVMHSSALLEVFGNAQTRRNHNSSRFGKLAQLQFAIESRGDVFYGNTASPSSSLIGSVCTTYLLEKSRVVSHALGERSFHIFYQLLAAPQEFKQSLMPYFALRRAADFSYLSQHGGECDIDDPSDREKWNSTVNALREFNIQGDLLVTVMQAIATVLQLGNIQFGEAHTDSGERTTVITSKEALENLGMMIGIEQGELETALTSRSVKTNFEELRAPLQPFAAKEATDALAKEIYSKSFRFIVRHINEHMKAAKEDDIRGTINLVDIYGFERLAVNRFEQLCINYANEQLQQKYVADNFRILKEEYDNEGIDIFDFSLVDNSQILSLIDGRSGVFVALQEECSRPMGSDESFVEKVKSTNSSHPHLISQQLHSKKEFGIRHFAGPVTYDATKFIERNMDKIPEEFLTCAAKSPNNLIQTEMQKLIQKLTAKSKPDDVRRKISGLTTIEKFSIELRDLLVAMEGTRTRYIRCIIPNETMSPGVTNHMMTLRQLEYAGLMTCVALTRESLPDCLSYKILIQRFGILLKNPDKQKMKEMELADQIVFLLRNLFMASLHGEDAASMPFACGKTKAYLRAGALEHLERLRYHFFFFKAVDIQKWFRAVQASKRFRLLRGKAIRLQAVIRIFIAKRIARRRKWAALRLSSWLYRLNFTNQLQERANVAASKIQSKWRAQLTCSKYRTYRRAVIVIQRKYRAQSYLLVETIDHNSTMEDTGNYMPSIQEAWTEENDETDEIEAIKKRIAVRKVELPRYRRADHDLLTDIDALLTEISAGAYVAPSPKAADSESSSLELEFLQGENESLRNECKLLGERTRTLLATIEDIQGSNGNSSNNIFAPKTMKAEIIKWKTKHEMANIQHTEEVRNITLTNEREVRRFKEELELAHQHNQDLISHATESQEAREELTREIAKVKAQLAVEQKGQGSAQLLEKQLSENQALHREETAKLKEELRTTQQLNLASSSRLHELQAAHAKEVEEMKGKIKAMAEAKEAESSVLEGKLQRQELNSRGEKDELCKMLNEAEEQFKEDIRILKEEVLLGEETQQLMSEEMNSLRTCLEKETEEAAKLVLELDSLQTKNTSLETELKKREQTLLDREEEFSKKLKDINEKYLTEKNQLQTEIANAEDIQRGMKTELSQLKASHALEQEKFMAELTGFQEKEVDTATWKRKQKLLEEKLQHQEERSKLEEARLKEAVENAENKHREEIRELKEELFWTQESERQLKSEISEMEASHAEEIENLNTEAFEDCNKANEEMVLMQATLERQEQDFSDEKDEMCRMLKDAEENHQAEVLKLNKEVSRLQESLRQVKTESIKLQTAHAEELEKMMTKTLDYTKKDAEVAELKGKVEAQDTKFREEKERLRGWLKKHLDDVRGLKEEFVQAQESHIKHLLYVLPKLEAIDLKRSEEITSILEELELLKREKDAAISALTTELELKQGLPSLGLPPSSGLPTISEAGEISPGELSELEERLSKNASLRSTHSEEFNSTLHKLQMAIKPDNLKYIIKKVQRRQDSTLETRVFTEIHRMSVSLGDLYALEERAQHMLHDEMLSFIGRFSSSSSRDSGNPSTAGDENDKKEQGRATTDPEHLLQQLQQRVSAIEKQNESLKKQLKASENGKGKNRFSPDATDARGRYSGPKPSQQGRRAAVGGRPGKDA